jgi:hypothetical protein
MPQLSLLPMLQLMLQPMPPSTFRATSPTMQLTLPTPKKMSSQTQDKTQEPNLHQCKLTTVKVVSVNV